MMLKGTSILIQDKRIISQKNSKKKKSLTSYISIVY
jgi:hypothetical protein